MRRGGALPRRRTGILLRHFILVDTCPQDVQQNHHIGSYKTVIPYENQEIALTWPVKVASIGLSRNENVSGNDVNTFSLGEARQEEEP